LRDSEGVRQRTRIGSAFSCVGLQTRILQVTAARSRTAPGIARYERGSVSFQDNGLFASLSASDQDLLRLCSDSTQLAANASLSGPHAHDKVYFLAGASVAIVFGQASSAAVAVGLVASSGAVGLQWGLGQGQSRLTFLVQAAGPAWVTEGRQLQALLKASPSMHLAVSRYLWSASEQLALFAANLKNHSVLQRLAFWISNSSDARTGESLRLTHSGLSSMLGVRRASISEAAYQLRALGLINYDRGVIFITNRLALDALSASTN
jgi:hypothetical protein